MYRVEAYDLYHNKCWLEYTEPGNCVNGNAFVDTKHEFRRLINNVRYVRIVHPITGERVPVGTLQRCGIHTKTGKRIPAYYRIYENDTICYIYITKFGRSKFIRNYQTRRVSDSHIATIIGYPIIHTSPYIMKHHHNTIYDLIIGEGDPDCDTYNISTGNSTYTDQWGDTVRVLAHCSHVTLADTEGSWHGYTFEEYVTYTSYPLQRFRQESVIAHLMALGNEFLDQYGPNFTKW